MFAYTEKKEYLRMQKLTFLSQRFYGGEILQFVGAFPQEREELPTNGAV